VSPDPFDTLGLRPDFDLDLEAAGRRHLELSKALHPDRFTQSPKAERRQALGRAIEVNEAWRLLRDPVRRAEALLARLGLSVEENQEPRPDPGLLMEMMELREALSEAGQKRDESALDGLVTRVGARRPLFRRFPGRSPARFQRAPCRMPRPKPCFGDSVSSATCAVSWTKPSLCKTSCSERTALR
jgi:Fe-S protein assembly co-chaperone HscB